MRALAPEGAIAIGRIISMRQVLVCRPTTSHHKTASHPERSEGSLYFLCRIVPSEESAFFSSLLRRVLGSLHIPTANTPYLASASYFRFASSSIASTDCFSASVFHDVLALAAAINRFIHATKYAASAGLCRGAPATFT